MREKDLNEGLGELAHAAEKDHEVQMARADLYKLAKYAIKLHDMLKKVPEEAGLEGWVQSKITKAADYIGSVYHHLDYEDATGELGEAKDTHCSDKCCGSDVKAEDCTCPPDCPHCNCNAVNEGKFKSDAHRKAIHAGKASGKRSKKKLRDTTDLSDRLAVKLESKKKVVEKAKSKAQQKFMGMVYAAKQGEKPASPEVAKAAKGMSKADAKDYASTKHKGKPERVGEVKATKITPTQISASKIKSKKLEPKSE
jgi:hypothetical protein